MSIGESYCSKLVDERRRERTSVKLENTTRRTVLKNIRMSQLYKVIGPGVQAQSVINFQVPISRFAQWGHH